MSLLGSALNAVRGSEPRATVGRPMTEWLAELPPATDAGIGVNSESSMRLSAVYGSRRIINYTIASLPAAVLVKRQAANGRSTRSPYRPEPVWLTQPNPEQTWPEFCAQMSDSLLSDGNLFLDISNKTRGGVPGALYVVDPESVIVARNQETKELFYLGANGQLIDKKTIVHGRALTLAGQDRGLSPIAMAREEIGIGRAAQKHSATFFVNGATVSATLEFPDSMTEQQVKDAVQVFRDTYSGANKAHKVAAIAGGTYKPMAVNQKDAQFLESRNFTVVDIGTRIYGIPPHRLGAMLDTPQFGNSIEQYNWAFVQDAVIPWVTIIEALFKRYVVPSGSYFHMELNGLLRGDAASRAAYYQTMRQQLGVFNADDILELEDRNPLPEGMGQAYWMPANTYLVGPNGTPILPERTTASALDPLSPIRAEKVASIKARREQDQERGRGEDATREFADRILAPLADAYRLAGRELDTEAVWKEALT